ncbi:hypothetical protein [uncultured Winogradskyella sp.]|uniref:hypothetical protein n=1 Tax=uncultured Winogradskyella sp. TaxID=395353 RepID=UPI002602C7F9|nr:hypothetical protein [uncultured Winogradskyella sp.]
MYRITLLFIIFAIGNNLNAQKKSKQEVVDLMAEDTCECIAQKKLKTSDSMEEKEIALGLCLITSFNTHKGKSKYYKKKSLNDIEEIGQDVGIVMATMCADDFMSIFSSEELVDIIEDKEDDIIGFVNSEENNLSIEVELVSMNNDAISYIKAKDDFDKNHIFLITEEFEGYDLLKKSNFGKSFTITFKEVELFDLSEKQYITKKVITKIEAL